MVSAKVVSVSNTLISKTLPTSPTALFVGGTNGIGRTTLEAFAASTQSPTVFFVGRSQTAAEELLRELETKINAKGTYGFYIANCTLLSEVDRVCEAVKERLEGQNKGLDYLFLSCGYVALARDETREGLDALLTVRYYARMRFLYNLLPLKLKRVLSILTGTFERPMILDDLSLNNPKNYSFLVCASHSSTMTTASFEHLAREYPDTAFVHAYPGIIKTNVFTNAKCSWIQQWIISWVCWPLLAPFQTDLRECGERCLYYLTSKRYPSLNGSMHSEQADGVQLGDGVKVAEGEGVYSVGSTGEGKPAAVMNVYREKGVIGKIWEHTLKIFEEVEKKRL